MITTRQPEPFKAWIIADSEYQAPRFVVIGTAANAQDKVDELNSTRLETPDEQFFVDEGVDFTVAIKP
jgi:hypothetical protein